MVPVSGAEVADALGGGLSMLQGGGLLLLVTLVGERLMKFFKNRGVDLQKIAKQVDTLSAQHNVMGTDGVPVWYVRRSLEDVIGELAKAVNAQTVLLSEMVTEIRAHRREDEITHEVFKDGIARVESSVNTILGAP